MWPKDWVVWYIVLWRTPWFALAYAFRCLFCLAILIGWGWSEARSMWKETA
jgi:hypothetical protein